MDIQAMIEYMNAHEKRYDNHKYRYSQCIKVHNLGLSKQQADACMEALMVDNVHEFSGFNEVLENFESDNPGFEVFSEGRHEYLVLQSGSVDMFNYLSGDDAAKYRYKVLKAFDEAVEQACAVFVDFAMANKVVEKTIMVPKTIRVFEQVGT